MSHSDGGKGSVRRKEDVSKINENWDRIFGNRSTTSEKEKPKMGEHEEHKISHDVDDEEWSCDVCGGPMYAAPHWTYGQCDDCGARQELETDY